MTQEGVSSLARVTDARAARLLTHGRTRLVLGQFLGVEGTVGAVSKALELDIRVIHRDVLALVAAGLLTPTRRERRAGRAVQHYRASADAYFVPLSGAEAPELSQGDRLAAPDALLTHAFEREFERALRAGNQRREWGLRLYRDPDGRPEFDACYPDAELRAPISGWQGPQALILSGWTPYRLTDAQASEVQIELIRLMSRLMTQDAVNEAAGHGRPFLLRLGLAPITEDEAASLRRG